MKRCQKLPPYTWNKVVCAILADGVTQQSQVSNKWSCLSCRESREDRSDVAMSAVTGHEVSLTLQMMVKDDD